MPFALGLRRADVSDLGSELISDGRRRISSASGRHRDAFRHLGIDRMRETIAGFSLLP